MPGIRTVQDALRHAGVKSIGELNRPRNQAYAYGVNFPTDISAGGNAEQTIKTDAGALFVIQSQNMTAWVDNPGAGLDRTPLARESSITAASNTYAALGSIGISIRTTDVNFSNGEIRADLICGRAEAPGYWIHEPIVAPGASLVVSLTNYTELAIRAQVALIGIKIYT